MHGCHAMQSDNPYKGVPGTSSIPSHIMHYFQGQDATPDASVDTHYVLISLTFSRDVHAHVVLGIESMHTHGHWIGCMLCAFWHGWHVQVSVVQVCKAHDAQLDAPVAWGIITACQCTHDASKLSKLCQYHAARTQCMVAM